MTLSWNFGDKLQKVKTTTRVHFCEVVEMFELVYHCSLSDKSPNQRATFKGVTGFFI